MPTIICHSNIPRFSLKSKSKYVQTARGGQARVYPVGYDFPKHVPGVPEDYKILVKNVVIGEDGIEMEFRTESIKSIQEAYNAQSA